MSEDASIADAGLVAASPDAEGPVLALVAAAPDAEGPVHAIVAAVHEAEGYVPALGTCCETTPTRRTRQETTTSDTKTKPGGTSKMYAPGIGALTLSISAQRSEICFLDPKTKVRRHLITLASCCRHGDIAVEVCRFAMNNDVNVDAFRFLAKEKLKQMRDKYDR